MILYALVYGPNDDTAKISLYKTWEQVQEAFKAFIGNIVYEILSDDGNVDGYFSHFYKEEDDEGNIFYMSWGEDKFLEYLEIQEIIFKE